MMIDKQAIVNMSLPQLIKYLSSEYGEKMAICQVGLSGSSAVTHESLRGVTTVTYSQLWNLTEKAINYCRHTFKPNQHVAIVASNSLEWILAFLGVVGAGAVAIPLDESIGELDLRNAVSQAELDAIFVQHAQVSAVREMGIAADLYDIHELSSFVYDALSNAVVEDAAENDIDAVSVLMKTSGSMGKTKYCMLTQRNLMSSALNLYEAVRIDSGGTVITMLPFHHSFGLSLGLLYQLICGSRIIIGVSPIRFLETLGRLQPDYVMCVPEMVSAMVTYFGMINVDDNKRIVKRLKYVYCGGAPANADVISKLEEYGISLILGYGLTECSPLVTASDPCGSAITETGKVTVGKTCGSVRIRIVDGELEVKSPSVMKGYFGAGEDKASEIMHDGWLRTGDLAHIDDEGNVFITGRRKNVIVLPNGEKIIPEEIEQMILTNDRINYCYVYEHESIIHADIFAPTLSSRLIKEWVDTINSRLTKYKRIVSTTILSQQPQLTSLGKVIRHTQVD